MSSPSRRTAVAESIIALSLTAFVSLGLTSCGDSEAPDGDFRGSGQGSSGESSNEAPPECAEIYPMAYTMPDLNDVELLPEGWPEPPVEATLCETSTSVGTVSESASYITPASEQQVIDAYVEALAPYGAEAATDGNGEPVVWASADGINIEIQVSPGAFQIILLTGD